ncbi:MAG TPA: TAXI family TRAP transporter solute-binding subunit [Azospirillaceae bacterium]|nr:TAXI family TRAP transporter solute-binding subunit [Azospirillaceae bacterium]
MPLRLPRLLPVAGVALVAMAVWRAPEVPAAPKPLDGEVRYLRIAAGPATTASFAGGSALASAVTRPPGLPPCGADGACGVSGLVALVQSVPGPDAVVAAVAAGRIDSGLAPADSVLAARCAGAADISVIANLYEEALHVAVRPGLDAASVADLKGRRVAIGGAGSAERRLADRVLTAHGLKRRDVRFVELSGAEAAEALAAGEIDALFRLSPWPDAELSGLAERGQARLLPVAGEGAERLMALAPFGGPVTLPDGLYPGSGAVATLTQPVQWIATPALEPTLVAKLAEALARPQNRALLRGPDDALTLADPAAAPLACPGR